MQLLVGALLLVVLFFVAYFGVEFGSSYLERQQSSKEEDKALSSTGGAGAFREIYFFLWSAIFWGGFCLLLPLSLSFSKEVERTSNGSAAVHLFLKIAAIPFLLLFLIFYGRRKGYLRWIKELNWPKQL
jgi:hypothetical protein